MLLGLQKIRKIGDERMKKKVKMVMLLLLLLVPLLTGAFLVFMLHFSEEEENAQVKIKDITMFSAYTEAEALQNVPVIRTIGAIEEPVEYGEDGYVVNVNGSSVEEYKAYLKVLDKAGFVKHSDNGEDAMEGNVLTSSYTKGNTTLTVSHAVKKDHTYISAGLNVPLSDHLIYKEEDVKNLSKNSKTSLHLMQLNYTGNSFVIQLKNGHFIVEDGGTDREAPYLLDYLESLTPEGEKPVIDAWFITHPHSDHCGAVSKIATTPEYLNRIYVEGFYYYDMSPMMLNYLTLQPGIQDNWNFKHSYEFFKTTTGESPKLYRPQFGQKYYFCDISIDVALTIEQCTRTALDNFDLNDSSTWLMHHIDGQKFLSTGDSNYASQYTAIFLLDQSYFDVDLVATPHHAINMYDEFVDYCKADTLLYTSFRAGSIWKDGTWKEALAVNERMREAVKEYYHYGDGTVVFTFPYTTGAAKLQPSFDWMYHGGNVKRDNGFMGVE